MNEGSSTNFGRLLRRLREAAGLTQAELAERAGISEKAVGALESGRRQRPYPSTVRALADALGLTEHERAELLGAVPSRAGASLSQSPARIPAAPSPIIGRSRELANVADLLADSGTRLITITGPGGVGKTRLALEVASREMERGGRRVAFVPLAPLSDPVLVLPAIAQALELPENPGGPLPARLGAHLAGEPLLLVLDNLEHLLEAASDLAALLEAAPNLTIIATSRAPLRIRAEHEVPLKPLDLPDMTEIPALEDVANSPAVQLFIDRARTVVPDFELNASNFTAVAAICRRLDGLPLALELVAARLRALSPLELLARLEHALPVLGGGARDLPERQQTLEAAIEWSYKLLDGDEQVAFRRLAPLTGGWTLEAAEMVAGWGDLEEREIADLLAGLIEQSLVTAQTQTDGSTRYAMLETIRQYARKLAADAGEFDHLRDRHLAWCLQYAQQAMRELRGPDQHLWLDRLEREHDNMRAALLWAGEKPMHKKHELRLATALWRFWETRGYVTEGRRWLDRALTDADRLPARIRADALNAAGNLARDQGDLERAAELHDASLELRRKAKDAPGIARSLVNLGNVTLDQGKYTHARVLYTEALERFRELDNEWDIANALNNLGIVCGYLGEYDTASELLEEALELRRKLGESASLARTLDALGVVVRRQGELDRAEELHEQSLAIRKEIGEPRGIALATMNLGQVARYRGDLDLARRLIEEALEIRREVEDRFGIAICLNALADIERLSGDTKGALKRYRQAMMMLQQIGVNDGLADSLLGVSAIALDQGEALHAARLLAASDSLRESLSQRIAPIDQQAYDDLVDAIRERLDEGQFEREQAAGRAMTVQDIVALAVAIA